MATELNKGASILQRILLLSAVLFLALLVKPTTAPKHFDKQGSQAGEQRVSIATGNLQIPQPEAKAAEVQSEPTAVKAVAERPVVAPTSSKEQLMQQAGIPQSDWAATDFIVSKESSWNPTAMNRSSGAHGLCQSLPATKMASEGEDYMTNPVTQLRWCHKYASQRYGGWWASFAFWKANNWW